VIVQCFFGVLDFRKNLIFNGIFCHEFPIFSIERICQSLRNILLGEMLIRGKQQRLENTKEYNETLKKTSSGIKKTFLNTRKR
jgi:hypothetical protein